MIKSIVRFFDTSEDKDPAFTRLTQSILLFTLLATVLPIFAVASKPGESAPVTIGVLIVAGLLEIAALIQIQRGNIILAKAIVPIALIIAVTIIAYGAHSIHDISVVAYPVIIVIATLLQGRRATILTLPFAVVAIIILGTLDMLGLSKSIVASRTGIDDIVIGIILMVATAGILNLLFGRLNQAVETARANEKSQMEANTELRELKTSLEERITERTIELEKANTQNEQRVRQLEAIALISNAITSIRSLDELLPKITDLIGQYFGYYHVGIFLNDANNENAVLSAANSEGGKGMLSRGHQLKIGQQGIVGFAISTDEPRIALDVGEDAVYFGNPELPDTRSEIALPLKIGDTVVGALDVQSDEASAFGEEDINVLTLLADQVSMAIENARLFDQARKSLAESEALYRQYLRQAWNRLPKEQNLAGYRYNIHGAFPIDLKIQESTSSEMKEADDEIRNPRITVPIAIRGETIGTLAVQVPEASAINDDQMDLVNAVAERVALSVENARLFEETTRRAERERLVSDITVKIRSTNDPDIMIETALEELKQALGATKVQLVPHTLQKTETSHQPLEPTPRSSSKPSQTSHNYKK